MNGDESDGPSERSIRRVGDALVRSRQGRTGGRLREWRLWLLVDADRRIVVVLLAGGVFLTTVIVGLFGPVDVHEFLTGGTSLGEAYIELQPGIITAITVVLAINQLILSPDLGPVSLQRQRLTDATDLRSEVEDIANEPISPTEPSAFMGTVIEGIRRSLDQLEDAIADDQTSPYYDDVQSNVEEAREETRQVSEALADTSFGDIGFIAAMMHYDASRDIRTVRRLENEYTDSLSNAQLVAFGNVIDALNRYTVAREFFRTVYLRSEFAHFSRILLYTALPAILIAHYTVGIVGEGVLTATTLGVPDLLWFESAAFTATLVPVLVIVSYVARLLTVSETSIFVSPFTPEKNEGG